MADKKIKVTLVKSIIGTKQDHRATVRGLGLRKLNSTSELVDTPSEIAAKRGLSVDQILG